MSLRFDYFISFVSYINKLYRALFESVLYVLNFQEEMVQYADNDPAAFEAMSLVFVWTTFVYEIQHV